MTPEDRAALEQLLDEALSLAPEQWEPLVKARFEDRPELIREARSLLEHAEAASARFPAPEEVPLPKRAGPYRLIQELGRGGMGVVFLGERDDGRFEQRVAVKLLPPLWGMAGSTRRFDAECRILARLEHPRICRILDSGRTAEGWPFLTMELVDGRTLDRWCANTHPSESQKLAVFLQICSAVQYAHSNLVIHRDLKPPNIIINAAGDAKLLDFGIAKLLSADTGEAQPTIPMLTPKYASPEQLEGEPATTASDVYSLGLILQELTGPQSVPDLQAIVAKAAAKEPAARYGSVAQLAEDIDRYLARAPVLARRQTFAYVASRLLRRYKRETGFAAVAALLLLAGISAVLWESRIAARERARALQHFDNIRKLAGALVFDLHDRIEEVPGALNAREALLARGTEYLDILAKDAGSDPGLLVEVAQAYRRLAGLQFETNKPTRLNLDGAIVSLEKAEVVARAAMSLAPASREPQLELLRVLVQRLSRTTLRSSWHGSSDEKIQRDLGEETLALARNLARKFPADIGELGAAQFTLASTYERLDSDRAIEAYRESLENMRLVLAGNPEDPARRRNVAITARALGVALLNAERLKEAKSQLEEALAVDEQLEASQADDLSALNVTFDLSSLFTVAESAGDLNEALNLALRMTRMREQIVKHDPSDEGARLRLWYAYSNVSAEAFVVLKRPADAIDSIRQARVIESHLSKGKISEKWLARARYNEGRAREMSGNQTAACALFHESNALYGTGSQVFGVDKGLIDTQDALKRCESRALRR